LISVAAQSRKLEPIGDPLTNETKRSVEFCPPNSTQRGLAVGVVSDTEKHASVTLLVNNAGIALFAPAASQRRDKMEDDPRSMSARLPGLTYAAISGIRCARHRHHHQHFIHVAISPKR